MSKEKLFSATFCIFSLRGSHPYIDDIFSIEIPTDPEVAWRKQTMHSDAAIDRLRSEAATSFLKYGADVILMCDDDCVWSFGDARYLVRKAYETKGIVGALVSKRTVGNGFGGRLMDNKKHEVGSNELVLLDEDEYVGGAFTAIHRSVFEDLTKTLPKVPGALDDFWPFFMPMVKHNKRFKIDEYLSEDWALVHRAREAGHTVHIAMRPVITHYGAMGYTVLEGNM